MGLYTSASERANSDKWAQPVDLAYASNRLSQQSVETPSEFAPKIKFHCIEKLARQFAGDLPGALAHSGLTMISTSRRSKVFMCGTPSAILQTTLLS